MEEDVVIRIERLSGAVAASIHDITTEIDIEFTEISKSLRFLSHDKLFEAQAAVAKVLGEIANAKKQGQSNYVFFKYLKLQKQIIRVLEQLEHEIMLPENEEIIQYVLHDNQRNRSTDFADSVTEFIDLARQSEYFDGWQSVNTWFSNSIPAIFGLNFGKFFRMVCSGSKKTNVISGHCLLGFEPNEKKDQASLKMRHHGLLLQDIITYIHVSDFARRFRQFIEKTYIAFDSIYYSEKIKKVFEKKTRATEVNELVADIVTSQQRVVRRILPDSNFLLEHKEPYYTKLKEIVDDGLETFVINEVGDYMGNDLCTDASLARSLAFVAATYLYSPLILRKPILAVESALNFEVPARIVLPYLRSMGQDQNFAFLALIPLPDVKMAHGAMHYGSVDYGKIFSADSSSRVNMKVDGMSVNWRQPHRCWFVRYHLSRGSQLSQRPCSPALCMRHKEEINQEINELLNRVG